MTNDQKARVLKMVLATLQQANMQTPGKLTVQQTTSALSVVESVLKDDSAATPADTMSPVDIAQLILQILQMILSNLPAGALAKPAAVDDVNAVDIGEIILQILELLLSKVSAPTAAAPSAALSPVDIAGLILQVLQLLLNKFAPPAPAPAPTA